MQIISGSFGVKSSAYISRDKLLVVEGDTKGIYAPEEIVSVTANVNKEKKFGVVGFIIGGLLLSVILYSFLGVAGVLIAVILALVGSFYSDKINIVDLKFSDNKQVSLDCTPRGVRKLMQFSEV